VLIFDLELGATGTSCDVGVVSESVARRVPILGLEVSATGTPCDASVVSESVARREPIADLGVDTTGAPRDASVVSESIARRESIQCVAQRRPQAPRCDRWSKTDPPERSDVSFLSVLPNLWTSEPLNLQPTFLNSLTWDGRFLFLEGLFEKGLVGCLFGYSIDF
jgi:hypothetical protein